MGTVKKVDCAILPPCAKTVHNKLLRAHFISIIWGNAYSSEPADGLSPLDYGWKDDEGMFVPDWFQGPAMPDELFKSDIEASSRQEENAAADDDDGTEFDYADVSGSDKAWSSDDESDSEN